MDAHIEPTSRPARLPLPSDLSAVSDADLMQIIESWAWEGEPVTWDQIVGHEAGVEALQRTAELLRLSIEDPAAVAALGISTSFAGALIVGPTGTGKSMLARAAATAAGGSRSVLAVPTAQLTPLAIDRIYAACTASGRDWLLLIDEAERIIGPDYLADADLKISFLAALDGLHRGGPLTVATTTVDAERVDPAARRPGRLSPTVTCSLPSPADRHRMLEIELARRPTEDLDIARLVDRTSGWSGAELSGLVEEAAIRCLVSGHTNSRTGRPAVSMSSLEIVCAERFALGDRGVGIAPSMLMSEHESGHAVFAAATLGVESVVEVRLTMTGGHTETARGLSEFVADRRELSPSARVAITRSELRNQIIGTLCGMTAEAILSGQVTTGANHDRAAATATATDLIDLDWPTYTGKIENEYGEYPAGSDDMRARRWREVDALLVECRGEAARFVTAHADGIRRFAAALFASPGQRLTGGELHEALRSALAVV